MFTSKNRRQPSRWIPTVVLAAVLILAAGCDRGGHPEQIGTPAPMFSVTDGQQTVDLSKLRGRVVVLNFWASWCAPCLEELPSLEQMQHDLPNVLVVAVSTDDDATAYQRFLREHT